MKNPKFVRMDIANFECLFPKIPLVEGVEEYGLIYVDGRGWDPCAIVDGVPGHVFFQDKMKPVWRRIDVSKSGIKEV